MRLRSWIRPLSLLTAAVLTVTLPIIVIVPAAHAAGVCSGGATTTWTGAASSAWTTAGNWDNGVPGPSDDVCVPSGTPNHPQITTTVAINALEVLGGLEILGAVSLTLGANSQIAAVNIDFGAELVMNANVTITGNADLSDAAISGSGTLTNNGTTHFFNGTNKSINVDFNAVGAVTWDGDNLDFGTHTVTNDGTWTVTGDDTLTAGNFVNNGTLTKTVSGITTFATPIDNQGTTSLSNSAAFTLTSGKNFTQTGNLSIAAGTLTVPATITQATSGSVTTLTFLSGSYITAGTYAFSNGVITGNGVVTATVNMTGGTVNVGGASTIGQLAFSTLNQSAGTIAVDLTGTSSAGVDYDQFTVTTPTLSGSATLQISTPSYTPSFSYDYYVFTYTTRTGTYAITANPANSFNYAPTYGSSALTVRASAAAGTITGNVYVDSNGNGTKDSGENTAIQNATVYIDADHDQAKGVSELSTTSDSSGNYSLANVPVGSADVDVVNAGGYVQTSSELDSVTVTNLGTTTSQNIGMFSAPTITGTVYSDANGNGTKQSGESGLSGITVYFDANNDGVKQGGETGVTTNGAGVYTFSSVAAGVYKVRAVPATGDIQTSTNPSDIVVTSGNGGTNVNFGFDVLGSISGTVFIDANSDGVWGATETAVLPGVTVFLDTNHNDAVDGGEVSTTTGANGTYTIGGVAAGTYDVAVAAHGNYAETTPVHNAVPVASNQDVTGINIGEIPAQDDPISNGSGYWQIGSNGQVYIFGDASDFGSPASLGQLNAPVVGLSPMPSGNGYRAVATDGGVFSYGDAGFYGSMGGSHLNKPITDIVSTPTGLGYWLAATDGGVFAYGDAGFLGSMGGSHLNSPIVSMTSTPSGRGYWLVASDGGVFAYGDAQFFGSMGGSHLNSPIVGIASTSSGSGYWLVAADGGVFSYGNATFLGSMAGQQLKGSIVQIRSVLNGNGYLLIGSDGGVFAYGDAVFLGNPPTITAPITG